MSTEPQNGAELLARIRPTRKEERLQLCLRPDLLEAHEAAASELAEVIGRDQASQRLATGTSQAAKKAAEKVAAIEAEIEETAIWFTLRSLPADEWRTLCDNHPPRKGNEVDFYAGYNRDAVLDAAVRKCLIDPVFDAASWKDFMDVCNPSEWNELRTSVNNVNRSVVDAPKSELASRILAKRATTSRQPKRGASAPVSSTAG